jgi:signal transduction histidine kinase/CheY-like chemotaxis protein
VLVLAPTPKDGGLAERVFRHAGLTCHCCSTLDELLTELELGSAALLVPEEVVLGDDSGRLANWLDRQPPWSDLPVVLLARPGADSAAVAQAIDRLGNVTVLERPIRVASLVTSTRTALRARQRQYQIREHLAERARAESSLRAGDRRKDEFLAILAHELRNPLAPIRNSLHILQLTAAADPSIAQVGEMLERQVHHLVRLVDDLLEVSRISQGKIELRKESIDLAGVLRTAVEASRPLIDAARHQLRVSIPPEPLTLDADPVRLAQVMENLLNNAAKYTEPGGEIWLTVRAGGGSVRITVRDSGCGISTDMLGQIFDLFTQGDQVGRRAQGGLGIGLTLVKRLVEMHGGSVEAMSKGVGDGSEFAITLPLLHGVEPGPSSTLRRHLPVSSARVLVVDDNHDGADSLGFLLRSLGCEVKVVYSGTEALEMLEPYQPTVVLLDIGMPGMDGHEVARRIRRQPRFGNLMLIALTGWGQEKDLNRTREAGFDHHLIKPADVEALETLLLS